MSTTPDIDRVRDLRLSAVMESLHDSVCLIDSSAQVVACNDAFARHWRETFGHAPRPGSQLDRFEGTTEATAFWSDFVQRALAGRSMMADGWHNVGGKKRYLAISATPVLAGDAVDGATIVIHDITDRRRRGHREVIELALTRIFNDDEPIEQNLAGAVEFLCQADAWELGIVWLKDQRELFPVAVWHDGSNHAAEFESAARKLRFAAGHGIPGRAMRDNELVWVPDLTDETTNVRTLQAGRLGFRGVVAIPISDSRAVLGVVELFTRAVRPVNDETARALHDTGLAIGRLIERHREHQERVRLLAALARKSEEWAQTFDSIALPIFLTTTEGVVSRLNEAARVLAGGEYDDILGRPIDSLGTGEPWPTLRDIVRAVAESRTPCTAHALDDEQRHWDVSSSSYEAPEGEERVIVVMRDVTTLVELQESVRRGEKLAAMGELVAGVAHEVRNPLFGMTITLDAYERLVNRDADSAEMFTALRTWIERLNLLMENLLEYGKTWNVDLREGNLNDVIEDAIALSGPVATQSRVTIRNATTGSDLRMLMDSPRLVQAIHNVIINAVQHSPAEGEVEISASHDGASLECAVRDHGPGFVSGDLSKIFEPFFTRRRGGTGLGLSIVQRIVDEHGGIISAGNHENGGAIVRVRFPVLQEP